MCECPCINILSIETSSYLNVETEPRTKWCCDRETEPMENLHLEMEYWDWPFCKYVSYEKF